MKRISISIDDNLAEWVADKAEKENRSISNMIETMLDRLLDVDCYPTDDARALVHDRTSEEAKQMDAEMVGKINKEGI